MSPSENQRQNGLTLSIAYNNELISFIRLMFFVENEVKECH